MMMTNQPKMQLRQLKGRQHSSDAMLIRFNRSQLDDNDDDGELDLFSHKPRMTSQEKSATGSLLSDPTKALPVGTKASRPISAPTSMVSTPQDNSVQSRAQSSSIRFHNSVTTGKASSPKDDSEKSFISGIRERIQDPLNSFIDKIEEFKAESQIVETIERKWRKSDSVDSGSGNPPVFAHDRTRHASLDEEVDIPDPLLQQAPVFVDDFFTNSSKDYSADKDNALLHSRSSDAIHKKTPKPRDFKLTNEKEDLPKTFMLSQLQSDVPTPDEVNIQEFYDAKDELSTPRLAEERSDSTDLVPKTESLTNVLHDQTMRQKALAVLCCLVAYVVVPFPAYISGLIAGLVCGVGGMFLYNWLTAPPNRKPLPGIAPLTEPLQIPQSIQLSEDRKFEGWMNELSFYDEDNYHINQTHSVFVSLDESYLRIQIPRAPVPKRAMWNETIAAPSFTKQRFFNLKNAKVSLLPDKLVSKRLWSKKYPICLILTTSETQDTDKSSKPREQRKNAPADITTEKTTVYLFGRTGREKEEWFRRFQAAAKGSLSSVINSSLERLVSRKRALSTPCALDSLGSTSSGLTKAPLDSSPSVPLTPTTKSQDLSESFAEYIMYMSKVMSAGKQKSGKERRKASHESDVKFSPYEAPVLEKHAPVESQVLWLNASLSRCFWDFLRESYWCHKIQEKLQKKLCKIHVPYFIDQLTVTGIELGSEVPTIRRVSQPFLDNRGLWIYLDIDYQGGFQMQLETKCNLMKLKKDSSSPPSSDIPLNTETQFKSAVTHSDEEDSAESSTDDEGEENYMEPRAEDRPTSNTGRTQRGTGRLLRLVDRIAQSSYFQQATEYKYIKRAMEGVSNTRLVLSVELKSITGTLALNIPPPPTDRLWYGFKGNPQLSLVARPRVGHRELNLTHITDWIERKLAVEFQRVFVMPNMDDLVVALMCDQLDSDPQESQSDTPTQ